MKRWYLGYLCVLAGLAAAGPVQAQQAEVTGVRFASLPDGLELVVELDGDISGWTDFVLSDPPRIVLDVQGVRAEMRTGSISAPREGVVTGVRTSQYSPDVVRVVVDLEREASYTIREAQTSLRIVFSDRPVLADRAARPGEADVLPVAREPIVPRITVSFEEADMQDVLSSFAEFTGRSIVPGSDVTGTVTATIRNQPWDVALHTILRAHGLAAQELPSGIIQVDAIGSLQQRAETEPLVTETFRVNYVPVGELRDALIPLITERGRVSVNPSTNTLIVTDVEGVINNLSAMVDRLDIRTPQVSIQAKIIFVNRTDVEELGVTYDLKDSQGNSLNRLVSVPDPFNPGELTGDDLVLLGGNSIAALGNANAEVSGAALEVVTSLVLGRFTLITFIDALQAAELSDVQAAPLITTLDNHEAEIWVGEQTPIRVVDLGTTGAAGGGGQGGVAAPRATAELHETGIRLRVTPHITADRRILMDLYAERSSAQLAATEIGVIFQQQQGRTRLMVEDGETAVIGGLTVTEIAETHSGIPILMDLPIIGPLFRTTRSREQKRDLLIMVTPHIVEDRGV